jgi:hypothetical protein
MNENEVKALWQESNNRLEKSLTVNKSNTEDITHLKAIHFISTMKPVKIFTLIIGIIWVSIGSIVLGNIYINAFSEANKFFLFSGTFQIGLTAIALIVYLYQIITIYQVDMTKPLIETQSRLSALMSSTLWVTRILFLQLPVWTIFYWNESMFEYGNWVLFTIQIIVTLSFTIAAIWLFLNIKYENREKKWFKLIFSGKEWTPLMKSIELFNLLEDYGEENISNTYSELKMAGKH